MHRVGRAGRPGLARLRPSALLRSWVAALKAARIMDVWSGGAGRSLVRPEHRAVLDWYRARLGVPRVAEADCLLGWMTTRGMGPEVVVLAIEATAHSRQPGFTQLEATLRRWYEQGVRCWTDLCRR
ncbi:DnaD domain protein [Carboxydochorda subterranea]|uniref:DnaD domain protein n=1 Tax=Carboxydichorda subterranea TaxID=3109565 RepID=A0ABZ1BWJ1_9FIRM|nr:DnaD domain protein [Limnochorda sp. L945t]WRP17171.1 DnaD domain protein [Limnochorda sp. L945t]